MSFAFHHAGSVDEAISLVTEFGPDAHFIAGGTDLLIQAHRGKKRPEHVIDISRIPGLAAIVQDGNMISIGPLVNHRTIERDPRILAHGTALAEASRVVGGVQVRHVATIGGNVANASPAADALVALLALDARIELHGPAGIRHLPVASFLTGPGRTLRQHDELISRIEIPTGPFQASAFLKAGRRKAMEISVVCVAVHVSVDPQSQMITEARIALGAVGPTALCAGKAGRYVCENAASAEMFRQAGEIAASECSPITDIRASADYRRMLVSTLVSRALERCWNDAAKGRQ